MTPHNVGARGRHAPNSCVADELTTVGPHIDRAVGPAVVVLKVFNVMHGLEPSVLATDWGGGCPECLTVLGSVWSSVSENCFETDGYVDDETMANEQLSNVMVAIQCELASGGRVYWHGAIAPDDLFWKPISKYDLFFQLCKIRAVFFSK
jgi:hypothetical protein